MAESKISRQTPIKFATVTATTNSGGSANLGLSASSLFVLSVRDNKGYKNVPCAAYENWFVNVYDTSGTTFVVKANVELTFTVAYIDI